MLERLRAGREITAWRAMNQWVNDGVPFAGAAFVQWIEDFYQQNLLARGALTIGGRQVTSRPSPPRSSPSPGRRTTSSRRTWLGR